MTVLDAAPQSTPEQLAAALDAAGVPRDALLYLACPYSHPERWVRQERFALACRVAGELLLAGFRVFSPLSHSHPICEYGGPEVHDPVNWLALDDRILAASEAVLVLCLDGWRESAGVTHELGEAAPDRLRLAVLYLVADPDCGLRVEREPSSAGEEIVVSMAAFGPSVMPLPDDPDDREREDYEDLRAEAEAPKPDQS